MRTYWAAHTLAMQGHEVHVVTNAKEVRPPFRMHMRAEDWSRCEAQHGSGSVTVHWTDPIDHSQAYIPMASPFVSKLAAIAATVHRQIQFDVIYSHYLEPYGVAAHLAAQMTGAPHVARMAGSDAGRLWRHPQFEALYDHVLRSAEVVIAGGKVAERAIERGVGRDRIAYGGRFIVPEDLFTPAGPVLDLAAVRAEVEMDKDVRDLLWGDLTPGRPHFGICGKLGESKGSFALLAAMRRLKLAGLDVGLVALAHGQPAIERSFRSRARKLGLADRILQIPFMPHWRVPEFLRGCLAVCCLEQDFPIDFHTPIIPLEVLLCGACLVGSTEVIRKLPMYARLPHGYGCVAIEDVNDVEVLADRLAAIAEDPGPAAAVGARARSFACELQREGRSADMLEQVLEAAATPRGAGWAGYRTTEEKPADTGEHRFPLTRLAAAVIAETNQSQAAEEAAVPRPIIDLARARQILAVVERRIGDGDTGLRRLVPAIEIDIAIAAAENEAATSHVSAEYDPLFRMRIQRWAMDKADLATMVPLRDPRLRVLKFDYDIADFMGVRTIPDLPEHPTPLCSYVVVFGYSESEQRNPLVIDGTSAQILRLSDGKRTASEIVMELDCTTGQSTETENLAWIESLFVHGLISLQDTRVSSELSAAE
jgi:glycosyltransferase involved in cell wall biosynthesis